MLQFSNQILKLRLWVFVSSFLLITLLLPISSMLAASENVPVSPYISAHDRNLYLNGNLYEFTGVNAFNIATYAGANAGCGGQVNDLDALFAKLRPNSMVRMWASQGTMATNVTTKQTDWTGLDRVVKAAEKNNIKLILVLGDQAGACDDGHWRDIAWYNEGYKQVFNDYGNGLTPLPYLDYVKLIVSRYKDSTAVAMWEPLNEPEAANCANKQGTACYAVQTCNEPAAREALRSFFDAVGGTIKSIDKNHLVNSGLGGNGQCSAIYEDYRYIHESPGIDVASYHDYDRDKVAMPGDPWNGFQKRIDQMKLVNKPLIVEEVGMLAADNQPGCISLATRRDNFKAKMDAAFNAGVVGYMPWALTGGVSKYCNYDIGDNDPTLALLRYYPVQMGTFIDKQAPTSPTNLTATMISPTEVSLTWNPSTDNDDVVRYDIFHNDKYFTSTTDTRFTNTDLTPGTTNTYHIKGKDAANNSSGSSNKITFPDRQKPTTPTNLTVTMISPTEVSLTWSASTDNNGVVRYDIFRNNTYFTSTIETNFTNTNLTSGDTYTYHVKGKDAADNSSGSSNKITFPDRQKPTAPTNLTAAIISPTEVSLTWNTSMDNNGVDKYDIFRDDKYFTSTTGTSFINTHLTPGTTYIYHVKGKDESINNSDSSNNVTITTPPL